jgi:hypothetical protein
MTAAAYVCEQTENEEKERDKKRARNTFEADASERTNKFHKNDKQSGTISLSRKLIMVS